MSDHAVRKGRIIDTFPARDFRMPVNRGTRASADIGRYSIKNGTGLTMRQHRWQE